MPGATTRRWVRGWEGQGSSMTSDRVECQARNTEDPGAGNPYTGIYGGQRPVDCRPSSICGLDARVENGYFSYSH